MKYSNALGARLCLALLPLIASALPSKRSQPSAVDILNFALNLEHIENAFYNEGLAKYSQEDFIKAGYPAWTRGRFTQIAQHEATHVDYLSNVIAAAGGKVPKPCTYQFPDHDVTSFIKLSDDFETVGTSAYTGAVGPLSNTGKSEYVTLAGTILATEARQSTWINSAVLKSYPWSSSFETPLTANEAFTIASGFIVNCPSDNPPLFASAYPALTVSPTTPGAVAQLTFKDGGNHGKPLFAAFLTGTGSLFAQINDKGEVTVPEKLVGTVYILVTKANQLADDTIIAGPALVRFSYPPDA